MNKITSTTKKVANHVHARRARYGAAAGFIAGAVVMRKLDADTYGQAMSFLKEKELYDEFFTLTDEM